MWARARVQQAASALGRATAAAAVKLARHSRLRGNRRASPVRLATTPLTKGARAVSNARWDAAVLQPVHHLWRVTLDRIPAQMLTLVFIAQQALLPRMATTALRVPRAPCLAKARHTVSNVHGGWFPLPRVTLAGSVRLVSMLNYSLVQHAATLAHC